MYIFFIQYKRYVYLQEIFWKSGKQLNASLSFCSNWVKAHQISKKLRRRESRKSLFCKNKNIFWHYDLITMPKIMQYNVIVVFL